MYLVFYFYYLNWNAEVKQVIVKLIPPLVLTRSHFKLNPSPLVPTQLNTAVTEMPAACCPRHSAVWRAYFLLKISVSRVLF